MRYRAWPAIVCALCLGWATVSLAVAQSAGAQKKKSAVKKKKKSSAKKKTAGSWRTAGQRAPTPERYKEIQEALASKGYLAAPPNGQWGPDSAEALKRFQQDQNLEPTGKLTALSLIALGLGPKRDPPSGTRP